MRLDEIIQTSVKVHTVPSLLFTPPETKELGGGSFSIVSQNKEDAHLADKHSVFPAGLEEDPYFQYVHRIVDDNLAAENPFFPRIYDIEIMTERNAHDALYKVSMERLEEYSDFSYHDWVVLAEQLVAHPLDQRIKNAYLKNTVDYSLADIAEWICGYIKSAAKEGTYENIKNSELIDAIRLIRALKETNPEFFYDIRPANCMVRRTPSGPQLVITDPLCSHGIMP